MCWFRFDPHALQSYCNYQATPEQDKHDSISDASSHGNLKITAAKPHVPTLLSSNCWLDLSRSHTGHQQRTFHLSQCHWCQGCRRSQQTITHTSWMAWRWNECALHRHFGRLVLSHAMRMHIWLCVRAHEKNDVWSVCVYTPRRSQWIAIDCKRNQL